MRGWCTTRCTTSAGRGCRSSRPTTRTRATCIVRPRPRRSTSPPPRPKARDCLATTTRTTPRHSWPPRSSAWAAALEHPDVYAPAADGANGGGPYDDDDVTDEFYWAAAELYLTTGESEYEDYLLASPFTPPTPVGVAASIGGTPPRSGRMDLATVPSDIPDREAIVASVVSGADALLAVQQDQGFGQALAAEDFVWGSNSRDPQQPGGARHGVRPHGRRQVPRCGAREHGLPARPQRPQPVVHHRLRHGVLAEPALAVVRRPARPVASPSAGGSVAGGPNPVATTWDPTIAAPLPGWRLRPPVLLRRRHRIVVHQRDHHQLELRARLGRDLPGAPDAPVAAGGGSFPVAW